MKAVKIDLTRSGIEAAKHSLSTSHPGQVVGFRRLAETQTELVVGHNEFIDRIADLEGRLSRLPFLLAQVSG